MRSAAAPKDTRTVRRGAPFTLAELRQALAFGAGVQPDEVERALDDVAWAVLMHDAPTAVARYRAAAQLRDASLDRSVAALESIAARCRVACEDLVRMARATCERVAALGVGRRFAIVGPRCDRARDTDASRIAAEVGAGRLRGEDAVRCLRDVAELDRLDPWSPDRVGQAETQLRRLPNAPRARSAPGPTGRRGRPRGVLSSGGRPERVLAFVRREFGGAGFGAKESSGAASSQSSRLVRGVTLKGWRSTLDSLVRSEYLVKVSNPTPTYRVRMEP